MSDKRYSYEYRMAMALAAGVFLGCIMGLVLGVYIFTSKSLSSFLHNWQTLIAGLLAFLASFLVFFGAIYNDISRRRKQAYVARACLPHTLAKINSYLIEGAEFYKNYFSEDLGISGQYAPPDFDENWLHGLRALAETESDDITKVVAAFITDLQIARSRMKSTFKKTRQGKKPMRGFILGEVIALCMMNLVLGRMYEYSRYHSDYDYSVITLAELQGVILDCGLKFSNQKWADELKELIVYFSDARSPLTGCYLQWK